MSVDNHIRVASGRDRPFVGLDANFDADQTCDAGAPRILGFTGVGRFDEDARATRGLAVDLAVGVALHRLRIRAVRMHPAPERGVLGRRCRFGGSRGGDWGVLVLCLLRSLGGRRSGFAVAARVEVDSELAVFGLHFDPGGRHLSRCGSGGDILGSRCRKDVSFGDRRRGGRGGVSGNHLRGGRLVGDGRDDVLPVANHRLRDPNHEDHHEDDACDDEVQRRELLLLFFLLFRFGHIALLRRKGCCEKIVG